ncbi:unnamed protein product [Arctogadus glacialis]
MGASSVNAVVLRIRSERWRRSGFDMAFSTFPSPSATRDAHMLSHLDPQMPRGSRGNKRVRTAVIHLARAVTMSATEPTKLGRHVIQESDRVVFQVLACGLFSFDSTSTRDAVFSSGGF